MLQIQNTTSYLSPHTWPIPSKILSHKSSSYSSSVQFLLSSAYFQFLFCEFHFPGLLSIPCHSGWLILTSMRKKTLPTCNPYLCTLGQGHSCQRAQSWTSPMNVSSCTPNGCVQGMGTSLHDWAVLAGMSAALLLRDIPAAAVIKALVQSMHVCTRSCAATSGLCLMNEAWLKCTGTQPIQIACSEDASQLQPLMPNVIQGTTCRNRMEIAS